MSSLHQIKHRYGAAAASNRRAFATGAALAAMLTIQGCASAGTDFDWSEVSELRAGQSMASVIQTLGPPNAERADGNQRVLAWTHLRASMFGAESKSLALRFDENGQLVEVPTLPAVVR